MPPVPAILVLRDGSVFRGSSIGAEGMAVGEVVFNTAMTGYQEILTDPSYARQLVALTHPHVGNTGVTPEDAESGGVHAAGLIVRDAPLVPSNWRSRGTLTDYLTDHAVPGIAGIDTRRLTRLLRDGGAQDGCLMAGRVDESEALEAARAFPGLVGMDLAREVTCTEPYGWSEGEWMSQPVQPRRHVVAYDFGVKHSILRRLVSRGCRVTVVPATTPADDALALHPDGVFLSNGPGDPAPCDYAIAAIGQFLEVGIPLFGICLGHQLLGLAVGASTLKMKFGHHGANHPVQDLATGRVLITSQNHGFSVDPDTLPANAEVTHMSLFDGSLQGFALTDRPAFCFQGHPEASPGPHDIDGLFDRFVGLMDEHSAVARA